MANETIEKLFVVSLLEMITIITAIFITISGRIVRDIVSGSLENPLPSVKFLHCELGPRHINF